ncbi:PH domain-containing protein [Larkinella ripae]
MGYFSVDCYDGRFMRHVHFSSLAGLIGLFSYISSAKIATAFSFRKMKRYSSRIGLELAVPLLGLLVGLGSVMIYKGLWAGSGIILVVSLLIVHLFMTTHYRIDRNILKIQSGFLVHQDISIESIKRISETNNPISSPALSLDRIEILYNRFDSVLISPKDKTGFIADLLRQKPDIEVRLKSKQELHQS